MKPIHCDLFCTVIDNFGDIGVCWRLARQLAHEHGLKMRLWVDDLASFKHLAPEIDPESPTQTLAGILVCRWDDAAAQATPADIVIEAFGCRLPEPYLDAMARRPCKPAWVNLEYLSGEAWVEGCHALPSPHPHLPLTCHFFFPGFTPRTGGLLREAHLLTELRAYQADPAAQHQFWGETAKIAPSPEALKISLFCYDNPALPELLDAWSQGDRPVFCAVPEGRILSDIRHWAGESLQHGQLTIAILPFLSQPGYDRLLASCDLNFVRGEDSFVRAQWAARPLVWHIYQQQDNAHQTKLDAFLDHYTDSLAPTVTRALRPFWQAWEDGHGAAAQWLTLRAALPDLRCHALKWTEKLAAQGDLASKLLIFCKNLLEYPAQ
jgi:uncharacterized repeat protein (TIGR03837 family)